MVTEQVQTEENVELEPIHFRVYTETQEEADQIETALTAVFTGVLGRPIDVEIDTWDEDSFPVDREDLPEILSTVSVGQPAEKLDYFVEKLCNSITNVIKFARNPANAGAPSND